MQNPLKLFSFLTLITLPLLPLQGGVSNVEKYLFTLKAQEAAVFEKLFADPDLFESPDHMLKAGFQVNKRVHEELMVATHPELKKYIFKKYTNKIPLDVQLAKYIHRVNGAHTISKTLKKYAVQHIIVPKKGIYRLPSQFGEDNYLVVAEYLDICKGDDHRTGENGLRYYNMPPEVLRELIIVMQALGGCDAWPRNQPFTRDGKIAFVDTEHVGEKQRHFARHIIPRLNPKLQKYATNLLNKLN